MTGGTSKSITAQAGNSEEYGVLFGEYEWLGPGENSAKQVSYGKQSVSVIVI